MLGLEWCTNSDNHREGEGSEKREFVKLNIF